jgi:hypothetical protein
MALTKVTKHVVHGSLLVQFKYQDLGDLSINTSNFSNVGASLSLTPKYADSILEQNYTGNYRIDDPENNTDMQLRLLVNGSEEYIKSEISGGYNGGSGRRNHGTPNDRSHSNYYSMHDIQGTMTMTHAFKPGNTNAQVHQIQARTTTGRQFYVREGFLVVKEISSGLESTPAG